MITDEDTDKKDDADASCDLSAFYKLQAVSASSTPSASSSAIKKPRLKNQGHNIAMKNKNR
jgi:hypothetical protein